MGGARNKTVKTTAQKAAEIVATLPVRRSDAEIAADIKRLVNELAAVMNEGDAVGLAVNFNIARGADNKFTPTQLTITKAMI